MGHLFSSFYSLPTYVDLRQRFNLPLVYQQGQCGDCTANAWCGLFEIESIIKNVNPVFQPSRLFLYFNERNLPQDLNSEESSGKEINPGKEESSKELGSGEIEGFKGIQAKQGAFLVNGLVSLSFQGVCSEDSWPYDLSKVNVRPSEDCYAEGSKHLIVQGMELDQELILMKECLNSNHPFVFGFSIYSNFHDSNFSTGVMLMPTPTSTQIGRHAVVAVGYSDALNAILCRNSWGVRWGMEGYFWMPYEFITRVEYAREFYYVENVT